MSVTNNPPLISTTVSQFTVPSTTTVSATANQALNPSLLPPMPANPLGTNVAASFPNISGDLISNSTSSSTSSDVDLEGRRGKRKRKWTDFFEGLMKGVVEKQEELQKKFLEALEKREQERLVREEAWRLQEMERINREREILARERSIAAARDAAVMSFLQKFAQQDSAQPQSSTPPPPAPAAAPVPVPIPAPQPQPVELPIAPQQHPNLEASRTDNNNGESNNFAGGSSSRWPKVEVDALIGIRTSLDSKYQDNGPKGPLWEEISAEMRKIGYNRSAKRCKEKWENINKYFKKVKESNKRRPEDSKTCPYFYQLDALYREKKKKNKLQADDHNNLSNDQSVTMMNAVPLMVQPEQQWPPPPPPPQQDLVTEEHAENNDQEQDELDEDEEEEDDVGDHFEIVANKPQTSMGGSTG